MIKPHKNLNIFDGKINIQGGEGVVQKVVPISRNQFLHKGASLRNSGWILGLVVYTGVETKLSLNLRKYRYKMSELEKNTNWALLFNLILMISMSLVLALFNYDFSERHIGHTYLFEGLKSTTELAIASFFSFWLIFNRLIPLELLFSMEMAKFMSTYFIQTDVQMVQIDTHSKKMHGLVCHTLNLHEELAEIEYLFCDKTGTLTKNELVFNSLSVVSSDGVSTNVHVIEEGDVDKFREEVGRYA